MSQSLNTLIGTFAKASSGTGTDNTSIDENKMISIDTVKGFLGFNTIDPSYAIHIHDNRNPENYVDNSNNRYTIKTKRLIITDLPTQQEINSNDYEIGTLYNDNGTVKVKNQ